MDKADPEDHPVLSYLMATLRQLRLAGGTGVGDVGVDLTGVVAAIRQELVETSADRSEQRAKSLLIMSLSGRQDEGELQFPGIAAGMEFGCEPSPRSDERLGRPSIFFIPAAQ